MSVAKLRLGDFHKKERQRAEVQAAVSRGKMTFADALQTYRERLKGDHSLKQRSKNYRRSNCCSVNSFFICDGLAGSVLHGEVNFSGFPFIADFAHERGDEAFEGFWACNVASPAGHGMKKP